MARRLIVSDSRETMAGKVFLSENHAVLLMPLMFPLVTELHNHFVKLQVAFANLEILKLEFQFALKKVGNSQFSSNTTARILL